MSSEKQIGFTLFTNASILTMDRNRVRAASMLCFGDRIVQLFDESNPDLTLPGPVRRVNLNGATITPGMNDSHIHFIDWGYSLNRLNLEACRSAEDVANAVEKYAATNPELDAIVGNGWAHNTWPGGKLPDSTTLLDSVAGDKPVVLYSKCLHLAWLNKVALERAGISNESPDPQGGVIDRNAEGQLTGILKENATDAAHSLIPERTEYTQREALQCATAEAHRYGITAIHSVESMQDFATYQEMNYRNDLEVKVLFYAPVANLDALCAAGIQGQPQSGRLTLAGVKLFTDGSLGGRTAWMLEPYENEPDNTGVPLYAQDDLDATVMKATQAGLACAIHAIGDAAIRSTLDAYEKARRWEIENRVARNWMQNRIEHFQTPHTEDIARAARLKIHAMMQPVHLFGDWQAADQFLGDRARNTYALRSAQQANVSVAFGSDAPVETVDVAASLHAAVCRQDRDHQPEGGWYPDEKIDLLTALEAHTLAGARIAGDAHQRGVLKSGAVVDLAIWHQNLEELPDHELLGATVAATYLDGECVYGDDWLDEHTSS
jgi:predicted amidohydrolase YtcJ